MKTNQKGFGAIGILLLFVVIGVIGFGGWYIWNAQQEKNEEISSLNENLESANEDLSEAESQIEELDNPEKKLRDTKRKNDLARFNAELNTYAANNNGRYPGTEPTEFVNQFEDPYISELSDFIDPNTKEAYTITPVANVQTPPGIVLGNIQYQWPGKCAGSEFGDSATQRQAAARILLESGDIYCLDA